jgi:23S rRNA (cytidine1920-2'-O)/16S rRNA (cytidine1409-2'-O)-methyltransferase
VSAQKRAPFVALSALLCRRYPAVVDPAQAILGGRVVVNGAPVTNPASRVRSDAAIRLLEERGLRGTRKLRGALDALGVNVRWAVALDLGAAAGGFTQALLEAGAARVYAVDAGTGQLRGHLRINPKVVNLERMNLAVLNKRIVSEPVDVVTIDLSYLALVDALPQIDPEMFASGAHVLALVKPTYELRAATLVTHATPVREAVEAVMQAITRLGWWVAGTAPCALGGSRGAVEVFVHARVPGTQTHC